MQMKRESLAPPFLLAALAWLAFTLTPGWTPNARPQDKSKVPAKAQAPDPRVIDLAGYQQVLARRRGKPVLVDFWATWCEPCRDVYPMINDLAKQYGPQGLVVIGVSLDDDGEMTLVRHFLARNHPVFTNYRKRMGKQDAFVRGVDQRWNGTIPADFLYDRDGRVAAALVGGHPREEFERIIRALLAGDSGASGK